MKPFLKDGGVDENASGKNLESLRKSEKVRSDFILKYGFIPDSILKHNRKASSKGAILLERRYQDAMNKGLKKFPKKNTWDLNNRLASTSNKSVRVGKNAALSTFPQEIGHLIVDFYCPKNGIVYDPFAGHNSRMELTFRSNRHYIGVDISKKFMKANRQIRNKIIKQQGFFKSNKTIKLIEGSSAEVDLPNNYTDFTITSPPYYDIEYYGNESEQLGKAKTYKKFLELISLHIKENFRILKPGSFCAWFVQDFIKDKKFHSYHADLIPIFISAGFEIFQVYIIDLGQPLCSAFVQKIIDLKYFPKRHEYCLLFKKPLKRRVKNEKKTN